MDTTLSLQLHMPSEPKFSAAAVLFKKEQVLLHCIAFLTFCQRMTVTIAHARLKCVHNYRYRSHYTQ